jgi:PAS domain S-box-containing protein
MELRKMNHAGKTKKELIDELVELQQRIVELEAAAVTHKQTDKALRESERKYRDLIDNSLVGIYRTNLEGKILYVNEALTKMLDFNSPEEMMSEGVLVRYKDQRQRECLLGVLKELGRVDNFEFDLLTRKGETIKALLSAVLDGDVISGMIMDISGRKQAEEALRKSEERFREMAENIREVFWLFDVTEQRVIYVSPAYEEIWGRSIETLYDRYEEWAESIHPDDLSHAEESFGKIIEAGGGQPREYRIIHSDGTVRWVSDRGFPIADESGKVLRVAGIAEDITERKRTDEELRQYSERLRILHEIDRAILAAQSQQAIAVAALSRIRSLLPILARASVALFDLENDEVRLLAVHTNGETNIGTEALFSLEEFGIPEEFYEGRTVVIEDIPLQPQHSSVDQALREEGMRSIINVPLIFQGELIGTLNFGAEEPAAFSQEHLEIAEELAGQLAVAIQNAQLFNSVTEQREELRALAVRLEELEDEERRRFVQELHDSVGQNLSALSINLNFVGKLLPPGTDTMVSDRLADCLTLVEETAERTRNLMAELRPTVLDDYGLMAALRWHVERFSERTELTTTLLPEQELKVKLPPTVETAIFRIAQEALTNIVKHAKASQVTLQVEEVEGGVRLVIADDGGGVDPKILRQPGGQLGWGLVTMRERAAAVGGHLSVNSELGKGTQVVLEVRG